VSVRVLLHAGVILALTILTQLGGLAWLAALWFRHRFAVFLLCYAALWLGAQMIAPSFGRVPLPCRGEVLRTHPVMICILMRNFVVPELAEVARDGAEAVARAYPGSVTLVLDGSFPFADGMPLIPHLSHDDGRKLDFAFYYEGPDGYAAGRTASPIGYFAFERAGAETCPPVGLTLRWEMRWFRPFLRDLALEPGRTAALIRAFHSDARVGKIFVEPGLAEWLAVSGDRIRFQGCRAARHDDHIHIQL
jgi:hypothetical protein